MDWLLLPAGVALILAGVLDVFFTVLHYDGFGFLSIRLYRRLFDVARLVTRPLPRKYRALGLSMAAPLMVPVTITVWIFLVSLGYALIYLFGMRNGNFALSVERLEPSFPEAFYFSGTAISTLGLGDITPTGGLYQALAVSEALIGFGILTLSITYVLGVYNVLQQLGVLSAGLYHQAQDTGDPWSILAPHFPGGDARGAGTPPGPPPRRALPPGPGPGPPLEHPRPALPRRRAPGARNPPHVPPPGARGDLRGHPPVPHRLLLPQPPRLPLAPLRLPHGRGDGQRPALGPPGRPPGQPDAVAPHPARPPRHHHRLSGRPLPLTGAPRHPR